MAAHGAQKLFGWFGGPGLAGTGGWLEAMGFRPARVQAAVNGLAEFGGGALARSRPAHSHSVRPRLPA